MRFEKSHKRVIFKTNYGFRRVFCVSYWRWMRRYVVWNRKKSKYNIWLWFILRFPSLITAGNEDFIGIFGGTKSSGFFFLRSKPHNFRASHLDPGHYLPSWVCILTYSSLLSLDLFSSWVTQERGRNLFANSLHHYSGQNMVLIQHRQCQLTLGVLWVVLCVFVCLTFPIYNWRNLDLPQAQRLAFHWMWLCFLFFSR